MSDANLSLLHRYYDEVVNAGNLAAVDEVFAPDYHSHHNDPVALPKGPDGVKAFLTGVREGFPDITLTVDDMFAEGDFAASRWTLRGTNTGPFFGNPPSGKKAEWAGVVITRFADGRIAEEWYNFDQLRLLQQLGVIPTQ